MNNAIGSTQPYPLKLSVMLREARQELDAGHPGQALTQFRQAFSQTRPNQLEHQYDASIGTANAVEALEDYESASRVYHNLLRSYPDDANVLRCAARVSLKLGQAERALALADHALGLDQQGEQKHHQLHIICGIAQRMLGKPQNSLHNLSAVLHLNPDNPDALLHHGLALLQLDRAQDALQSLSRAKALHPNVPAVQAAFDEALLKTLNELQAA